MDMRFYSARTVKSLAKPGNAFVGMNAHPADVRMFGRTQRFDRCDFHALANTKGLVETSVRKRF